MRIWVTCTRCESRFQVEEDLRGKRIRCPTCRAVFEARTQADKAAAPTAPPPPPAEKPPATVSGSVADFVPLLPAEFAEPAPPAAPSPPAVRKPAEPPRPPRPARPKEAPREPAPVPAAEAPAVAPPPVRTAPIAAPFAPPPDFPEDFPDDDASDGAPAVAAVAQEIGPGTWEAPPVRGATNGDMTGNGAIAATAPLAVLQPPAAEPPPPGRTARRRAIVALAIIALLGAGAGYVGWRWVEGARAGNEADRFQHAKEHYDRDDFSEAADAFQKLARDFPSSGDNRKYRFMAELSGVRGDADAARDLGSLKPALDNVLQFLAFNEAEALLKERQHDVWKTLHLLAKRLADEAERSRDGDALQWARNAWAAAEKKLDPPANVNIHEEKRLFDKQFTAVAKALASHAERQSVLGALERWIARPSVAAIQEARALTTAAGLKDDAEIVAKLAELVRAHHASIRYVPASGSPPAHRVDDDALPGVLVLPMLTPPKSAAAPGPVTLALARGVLYAFDSQRGELRWTRRVGIDTSVLPLRVPADPITPELVLVLSSDQQTVTALVADTGKVVWQHHLQQPCTGQPVLVERSMLVPTVAGRIDEVEISGGRLLGHYELGQRLTVGGARQPGTSLAYFPGDAFCVYVLDVAQRTCQAVLYSRHPAGSLRGVPILLPGRKAPPKDGTPTKGPAGWMLLCQAKGTATEVRPFELPIHDADQPAVEPALHVPGMSWFAPYHDAEKLALATDVGRLSLWGIRQKGNRDDPQLFRLLSDDYLAGTGPGRAQVVHADADNYWALTGGRLHRLNAVFRPQSGPGLVPVWPQPPALGSPLHAAQQQRDPSGRTTLFLTTLAFDHPTCLGTSIDAASGHFTWQRQLGCVPLQDPVALDGKALLRDPNGLILLDPAQFTEGDSRAWRTVDNFFVREPPGANDHVQLLAVGKEVIELARSRQAAARLRIRHISPAGAGPTEVHDLQAPVAGTPALGNGCLLLPLANGVAVRLSFGGTVSAGPNWRGVGVDEQATGHIVPLGGDEFLLTDGGRGLIRVSWPGKAHQHLGTAELGFRIVAPPAVLANDNSPKRVFVADASDLVSMLDADRLQVLRRWPLPGKITAGPFVRGKMVLCIVDRKRLMWIDPDRDEPLEYAMVADIVGAPVLVEGMLVTADASGRFVAFDAQTASPLGPGYTLRANTAPETSPLPFGPARLLVPLNDGTLALLPLAKLR